MVRKLEDTKIEIKLRIALWYVRIRYRKNYKALLGKLDIVITRHRIVVFCDSEFWHGKDWEDKRPRLQRGNNPDFWIKKIEKNMQRDRENDQKLNSLGWTVIHFWGDEITKSPDECVRVIEETIFEKLIAKNDAEQIVE